MHSPKMARPAASCYLWLFFFITVASVNKPVLARSLLKAESPPSFLVLYVHENRPAGPNQTSPVVVQPPGDTVFGQIGVVADVLRVGEAGDSSVLGQLSGHVTFEKDFSLYLDVVFVLSTPSCAGSITVQGVTDALGSGELAITGGTGVFRWAKGYLEQVLLTDENLEDIVYKATFTIKYD